MSNSIRRRIGTLLAIIIFGFILVQIMDRMHIIVLVQTPWYVFLLGLVVLFLLIDFVINRVIG
jgi:hypothetical protein